MRPFDGVVLVEGVVDADGRSVQEGALTWRAPVPIFPDDRRRILGHAYVEREGGELRVSGSIDLPVGDYGIAAGVIIDDYETTGERVVVTAGRLTSATLTTEPSYEAALIHVRRDHIDDAVANDIRQGVRDAYPRRERSDD